MKVYKDEPPCTECSGGCCISYDVIELTPDEVKQFGTPRILIGSDGCQYLDKGRCSIHNERPQRCRAWDCRNVTSAREVRALVSNGVPISYLTSYKEHQ